MAKEIFGVRSAIERGHAVQRTQEGEEERVSRLIEL